MAGRRTVLIVDDQRAVADALAARLAERGLAVRTAYDGAAALAAAEAERPDVALVDLAMPDPDGRAVAARLHALGVPVVLMSGVLEDVPDLGGLPLVRKPFDVARLLETIAKELGARS